MVVSSLYNSLSSLLLPHCGSSIICRLIHLTSFTELLCALESLPPNTFKTIVDDTTQAGKSKTDLRIVWKKLKREDFLSLYEAHFKHTSKEYDNQKIQRRMARVFCCFKMRTDEEGDLPSSMNSYEDTRRNVADTNIVTESHHLQTMVMKNRLSLTKTMQHPLVNGRSNEACR